MLSSTATTQVPLRIALIGATGKMGCHAIQAIQAAEGMTLAATLSSKHSLEDIASSGATHVLDLTVPDISAQVLEFAVKNGIHAVSGTSGWTQDKRAVLAKQLQHHPKIGVLIAPNFSIGAVLASHFAAKAAPYFDSVEIIEMHHPKKVDAPSGTAVYTAEMVDEARRRAGIAPSPDATTHDPNHARGAKTSNINIHSVRLTGDEAHQKVLLGAQGHQLTLCHEAFNRSSYMPGILLGLRLVESCPGLSYGLDTYLNLD